MENRIEELEAEICVLKKKLDEANKLIEKFMPRNKGNKYVQVTKVKNSIYYRVKVKDIYVGSFSTMEKAIQARDEFMKKEAQ